jgi:hypothetical protein
MLKIIREILLKIVNDIDTGNSNLSPEECEEVIEYLSGITNKNEKLSKYQACKYLSTEHLFGGLRLARNCILCSRYLLYR